jgi:hypothetical protein
VDNTDRSPPRHGGRKVTLGRKRYTSREIVIYQNPAVGARDGAATPETIYYYITFLNYRSDIPITSYARIPAANRR